MKHHIEHNIKSNAMEYKCHPLQSSKILEEKTKAHHNTIK